METLLPMARKLYRAYATARGRDHALYDVGETSEWSTTVPQGSAWIPAPIEDSSLDKNPRKLKTNSPLEPSDKQPKKPRKRKEKPPPKQYESDFVLAQEIDFLRDAINSPTLATAVAEGDIGRLYECIKVRPMFNALPLSSWTYSWFPSICYSHLQVPPTRTTAGKSWRRS